MGALEYMDHQRIFPLMVSYVTQLELLGFECDINEDVVALVCRRWLYALEGDYQLFVASESLFEDLLKLSAKLARLLLESQPVTIKVRETTESTRSIASHPHEYFAMHFAFAHFRRLAYFELAWQLRAMTLGPTRVAHDIEALHEACERIKTRPLTIEAEFLTMFDADARAIIQQANRYPS